MSADKVRRELQDGKVGRSDVLFHAAREESRLTSDATAPAEQGRRLLGNRP
jgi:hypothetical protein